MRADEQDIVVIEPQVPEYWPLCAKLGESDTIVLSRFAYLRRRGDAMVLRATLVALPMHAGGSSIVDLHAINTEIVLFGDRIFGVNERQRDEGAPVFLPRRQDR